MALSDSKLKSLLNKKQSKRFDIADHDSLSVRVSEFGTIIFQYRYRYHDKPSRIALGRYPDISLKQAREKIPELRQLLNDGFNPAVQTKRSKATKNSTLDECIDLFMKKHVTLDTCYQFSINASNFYDDAAMPTMYQTCKNFDVSVIAPDNSGLGKLGAKACRNFANQKWELL